MLKWDALRMASEVNLGSGPAQVLTGKPLLWPGKSSDLDSEITYRSSLRAIAFGRTENPMRGRASVPRNQGRIPKTGTEKNERPRKEWAIASDAQYESSW